MKATVEPFLRDHDQPQATVALPSSSYSPTGQCSTSIPLMGQ